MIFRLCVIILIIGGQKPFVKLFLSAILTVKKKMPVVRYRSWYLQPTWYHCEKRTYCLLVLLYTSCIMFVILLWHKIECTQSHSITMTNIVDKTTFKSYNWYIYRRLFSICSYFTKHIFLSLTSFSYFIEIRKYLPAWRLILLVMLYGLNTCDVIMDYYQTIEYHLQILIHKLLLFGFWRDVYYVRFEDPLLI